MNSIQRDLAKEVELQDLVSLISDDEDETSNDGEVVFDADSELMDDNLHQGMKFTKDGRPVLQTHLE
jgi:hypothetical protein